MNCPKLIRGEDWQKTPRWPLVMLRTAEADLRAYPDWGAVYEMWSGDLLLARYERGILSMCEGYACDSYSPVIHTPFGFLRLTPVPRCGHFPAVLHDCTRQMLRWFEIVQPLDIPCPFTRADTDVWFRDSLDAGGENRHLAAIYYGVVAGGVGTYYIRRTREMDSALRIERKEYAA